MENANLYLSLVSAAGMFLVGVSGIVVWRQKANHSYRWFLLGDVGIATAAIICGKLDTGFIWWVDLASLPIAIVSISILRWCWVRFGRQDSAQFLEPEMAVTS